MIELRVPYTEKDLAKRLGAKWHAELKIWFITNDMDPLPFSRWISENIIANINSKLEQQNINTLTIPGSLTQPFSLLLLVNDVKNLIVTKYRSSIWLIVEISELKIYNNNLFLTLVEYDAQGNLLARARGIIWNFEKMLKNFLYATNVELTVGIKILAQINLDYHIQYGLTLVINNLDPSYTLGEAHAKLLKIKQQLIAEGIFYNNKTLKLPFDFNNIAVISPKDAAGLGDFKQDASKLEYHNICKFDYYVAVFQGIDCADSVNTTITKIIKAKINYDVIVIIRGGGASSDLTWLNDYAIAKQICLTNIPVFSGIGHNKDETIIDQVSAQSFDTPSKVINFITNTIVSNTQQTVNNFEYIKQYVCNYYIKKNNDLLNLFRYIKTYAANKIQHLEEILHKELSNLHPLLNQRLTSLEKLLNAIMQQILSLSPEKTLARGFAIVHSNDENKILINSQIMANNYKNISLKFHDGEIAAIIKDR